MSRKFSVLLLVILSSTLAYAQGTNVGTAVEVGPNVSVTGSINDQSTTHYWKVRTTENGYLLVQINSATSIDVDAVFYDTNGTTTIMSDGQDGTYSTVFGFLKPGTYISGSIDGLGPVDPTR